MLKDAVVRFREDFSPKLTGCVFAIDSDQPKPDNSDGGRLYVWMTLLDGNGKRRNGYTRSAWITDLRTTDGAPLAAQAAPSERTTEMEPTMNTTTEQSAAMRNRDEPLWTLIFDWKEPLASGDPDPVVVVVYAADCYDAETRAVQALGRKYFPDDDDSVAAVEDSLTLIAAMRGNHMDDFVTEHDFVDRFCAPDQSWARSAGAPGVADPTVAS